MLSSTNLELNFMVNITNEVLDTFNKVRRLIPSSTLDEYGYAIDNHEYIATSWFGDDGITCRVTRNSINLDLSCGTTNYSNILSFSYINTIKYLHSTRITSGNYRMYRDNRDNPYYRISANSIITDKKVREFNENEIEALTFQYLTLYNESTTGLILYDSYLCSIMDRSHPMQFNMRYPKFTYVNIDINDMFTAIQEVLEQVKDDHFVGSD